jgi:DNA-directed RNA polymerase subunit RPC12/RpoP
MDKRYVDIDKFKEQIQKAVDNYWLGFSNGYHLAEDVIEEINYGNFDTADVEEVRHGKWIDVSIEPDRVRWKCSSCNKETNLPNYDKANYCFNCGARMTEE